MLYIVLGEDYKCHTVIRLVKMCYIIIIFFCITLRFFYSFTFKLEIINFEIYLQMFLIFVRKATGLQHQFVVVDV